ncbi:MAG: adenine phosphoribosyltransferase [Friedmanniella sp.]|nr:adenine phosphoribosyltransferase [Friedmanniella sp.]
MPVDLGSLLLDVHDFPQPGVVFKDVSPLLASPAGMRAAVDALAATAPTGVDLVVGMEARGFLFGMPVAMALGVGFAPVRKPSKLPRETVSVTYDLEYGTETLALHADAVGPGDRVLVVDDVLATGGTVAATVALVERLGGTVVGVSVLLELAFLAPRERLAHLAVPVHALLVTS